MENRKSKKNIEGNFGKWLEGLKGQEINLVAEAVAEMMKASSTTWRGALAIPPASFIETVSANFSKNSSIPPELAVMASFSYLSAYLCKKGIRLEDDGVIEWPTLWLAILARSGAGKTFVLDWIEEVFGGGVDLLEGTQVPTSKAFIEALAENPQRLFVVDEMGPFFAAAKDQGFLSELPTYLLHAYTHQDLSRRNPNGKGNMTIKSPVLNVLGFSATDSFFDDFDPKHMLTGLAQRFAWIMVEHEPKPMPRWKVRNPAVINEVRERWESSISGLVENTVYKVPAEEKADRAFSTAYDLLNPRDDIPDSFFRRLMHGAFKRYALLYHILLGKAEVLELDEEDFAWATRLAYIHAQDTISILRRANTGRLGKLLEKVEAMEAKWLATKGRELTPRDIAMNLNAVKSTAEAKSLLEMVKSQKAKTLGREFDGLLSVKC